LDLGLGVGAAVIAGSLFSHIAATDCAGFNTARALVAALAGAAALLTTFNGLRDTRFRPGDPIGFRGSRFKPAGVLFYVLPQNAHHAVLYFRANDHPGLRVHAHA
jgi:hypothetical protein